MIAALLVAAPLFAPADTLPDLRATLAKLTATTPVHGTFEVISTSHSSEDEQPEPGKASVGFEISDAGLRILYPRTLLGQAAQEAKSEAVDPERQTPTRNGVNQIAPLQLAELLDSASALNVHLQNAQLVQNSGRLLTFKVTPKLSKAESKHVKKYDMTLSIRLGDDGIPVSAERVTTIKVSFLLLSFESEHKESFTYIRTGDRLLASRHEETQRGHGLGQKADSQSTEVIKLEP